MTQGVIQQGKFNMSLIYQITPLFFSIILVLASLGVILLKKPVHACLSFLLVLMTLALYYLRLRGEFISVMQVLVYAGAILVIFMFVIVLFQDAFLLIDKTPAKSNTYFLYFATVLFLIGQLFFARQITHLENFQQQAPKDFGSAEAIGRALYIDFFFPFEAVVVIFLIAIVGALYIGKKVK